MNDLVRNADKVQDSIRAHQADVIIDIDAASRHTEEEVVKSSRIRSHVRWSG